MKKINLIIATILILILILLFLTGCNETGVDEKNSGLITYCDKKYGVEYIRDLSYQNGGITVRLDENGNIIRCK